MIDKHASTPTEFSIAIGGLITSVVSQDNGFIGEAIIRYQAFLTDQDSQSIIHVQFTDEISVYKNPEQHYEAGRIVIDAGAFRGLFNTKTGYGELISNRSHAVVNCEYFLRVVYAIMAFDGGGLLMHAAGIVREGKGYIFFGHSGSGKTTVVNLSRDFIVLNDDLVLLQPGADRWLVYATPFWNPDQLQYVNTHAPVSGMYRLEKSGDVYIDPLEQGTAIAEIISNVPVIPMITENGNELLKRCENIILNIPVYRLYFRKDQSFWQAIERYS